MTKDQGAQRPPSSPAGGSRPDPAPPPRAGPRRARSFSGGAEVPDPRPWDGPAEEGDPGLKGPPAGPVQATRRGPRHVPGRPTRRARGAGEAEGSRGSGRSREGGARRGWAQPASSSDSPWCRGVRSGHTRGPHRSWPEPAAKRKPDVTPHAPPQGAGLRPSEAGNKPYAEGRGVGPEDGQGRRGYTPWGCHGNGPSALREALRSIQPRSLWPRIHICGDEIKPRDPIRCSVWIYDKAREKDKRIGASQCPMNLVKHRINTRIWC